ncbi:polyribonucleotide nucleotidyltransferase [Striga asiatica]|uniref:Polyribonucleotide nucleotidyltransferase n=1 Tax=Striga asiatica TaxID=4170 RepID=A0A5A7QBD4_STRAF|nr:polyribonucleotide nucleotidyltransferase [Striga asiatica]
MQLGSSETPFIEIEPVSPKYIHLSPVCSNLSDNNNNNSSLLFNRRRTSNPPVWGQLYTREWMSPRAPKSKLWVNMSRVALASSSSSSDPTKCSATLHLLHTSNPV